MRISTVIPAYNRADLIAETLQTILSQSRPPDELIVVDDGSSDGTPDVVATFGKSVTLLCQQNSGAGLARNAGFAQTSGDIVHFMDSDDLMTPDSYAAAARIIEQGADMTYGPWLKARFDGNVLDPEDVVLQQRPVSSRHLDVLALLVDWVTVLQPCLFKRQVLEAAGPFRSDLKPSEDTELLYRLMVAAKAPTHVPDLLVLYPGSTRRASPSIIRNVRSATVGTCGRCFSGMPTPAATWTARPAGGSAARNMMLLAMSGSMTRKARQA